MFWTTSLVVTSPISQITWFGGSNMHINSPSIQRLLTLSQQYGQSGSNYEETASVILWARTYDKTKRSFLPYVCLGRVTYVSHDTETHPISFVLALKDYDVLMADHECHFINMLKIQSCL